MQRTALWIIICWTGFLLAQSSSGLSIRGRIYDFETNQGLGDANVEILGTPFGVAADSRGDFHLRLKPGSYSIRVSMMGYQTYQTIVQLQSRDVLLQIPLIPTVYLMQGVTIIQPAQEEETTVSKNTVQSENVMRMPGSLTDIYRSVKTLPGVTSNNGMSSEFNVRGGTFDENLVIVNGVQVYEPFHIKEAPNGSIAIFNMDLLKQVDLITGGFTARYGDKMSSVMNIQYRKGSRDRMKFQATGSMMHAGLVGEGPSWKGSWILGVRKSYLQYLIKLLGEDDAVHVDFYDIQGQIQCEPGPGKHLEFQFIHSGDHYRFGPDKSDELQTAEYEWYTSEINDFRYEYDKAKYYNNLYALSFTHTVNPSFFYKTMLSHYAEYEDEYEINEDRRTQDIWDKYYKRPYYFYDNSFYERNRDLTIFTTEARQEATVRLNAFHEVLTGVSFQHLKYDFKHDLNEWYLWGNLYEAYPETLSYSYENQEFESIHPATYKIAGYLEDSWQISSRLFANIGGRFDYFEFNRDFNISPRINLSYITGHGPILRAAWGHYYQSPSYRELKYTNATSMNTKAQRSIHHIIGIEYPVTPHWTAKVEGYSKIMDHLISFETWNGRFYYSQSNDSKGFANGLDVYMNWKYPKCSGWISYGYLVAREDSLGNSKGYIPRATDQRHTFALVLDYDLGKSWEFRIKALYGSGFPYTPTEFRLVNPDENQWQEFIGERNSEYLPSFQRLDLRIGKRFMWGRVRMQAYLETINTLARKNVFMYDWDWNNGKWERETVTLMPFIPNFGIEANF